MDKVKEIKSRLESAILTNLDNGIENVNCEEMSAVIDMVKDLAETEYHCAIVKAMERGDEMTPEMYRDWDLATKGRMYYTEPEMPEWDMSMGRSGHKRKHYYEVKNTGDSSVKMQSLEEYAKALHDDITEMIQGASENEKQMLRVKLQTLSQKI